MAWFSPSYLYKKQITIDHTKVSGGSDLSNFPVLISRTDADLRQVSSGGNVQSSSGFDIIFTDANEAVQLDHEIENYVAATGELEMWVRIPTLSASVDTTIYMYFGNSGASVSQEHITGVWDANYLGVWHMDDGTGSTTDVDSTSNANTAAKQSAGHPAPATGKIATGQSFNGTSDFASTSAAALRFTGDKTVEMWVNASTFAANADTTLAKELIFTIDASNAYMVLNSAGTTGIQWLVHDAAGEHELCATSLSTSTWYHVVGTYTASTNSIALYLNGSSIATTGTAGVGLGTAGSGHFGNSTAGTGFFTGSLDEIRISNTVRSIGWAATSYNNQNSPATFFSVSTLGVAGGPDYMPRGFLSPVPYVNNMQPTNPGPYTPYALGGTVIYSTSARPGMGTLEQDLDTTTLSIPRAFGGTIDASLPVTAIALAGECDGVGTLAVTLSATTALAGECDGVGTLTATLSANTPLTGECDGIGTLSGLPAFTLLTLGPFTPRPFGGTVVYSLSERALGGTVQQTLDPGTIDFPRAFGGTIHQSNVVTRRGTQLFLNGAAFRFSSANVYWLGLENLKYPTPFRVDDALATVLEMGGTVVRSHTLGISTGNSFSIQPFGVTYPTLAPFNDTAFNTIDYAIYRAGQLGLKLIIPLTDDNLQYHGSRFDFTTYRGVADAAFYTDSGVLSDFEAYISHVLNRVNQYTGIAYKDDPTIMAWETCNESATATLAWTDTIAQYIKSIDTIHLVQSGKTVHQCISDGSTNILALASLDMLTDHFYPPNDANVATWASLASANNKVFYLGEYDWTDTTGDSLASWVSTIEGNAAISGDLFWSLFGHRETFGFMAQTSSDPYALWYPGQTTATRAAQAKLRAHAYAMPGFAVPASSIPAAPQSLTVTVNALTWSGVVAANTYDVERSTTSVTGPFSVAGTGITDLDTPWTDPSTTSSIRFYRVRAYNLDGVTGGYSDVVTANYLAAECDGIGTLSPTLSISGGPLTAECDGVGTLTATLSATVALSITIVGSGQLAPTLAATTPLADTLAGVGTLSVTMSANAALAVTMVGVGTLSATLSGTGALTGECDGIGTLTATLSANAALADTIAGAGILSATLAATTALAVSLNGTGTLSGVFTIRVALSLTFAGLGTISGIITVPSLSFLTATWVTRDGIAVWNTRDDKATWDTRDDVATWKVRG